MPRMLIADKKRYPRLAAFVSDHLPVVVYKPKVWSPFLQYAQLSAADAKRALRSDNDVSPLLRLKDLRNVEPGRYANGQFRSATPSWIVLDEAIAVKFEADYQLDLAQKLVESTVLHEMVHWGEYRANGKLSKEPEYGKLFEVAAYDADVHRYWVEEGRIPLGIALDETDLTSNTTSSRVFKPFVPVGILNNNPGNIRVGSAINTSALAPPSLILPIQTGRKSIETFTTAGAGIEAIVARLKQLAENQDRPDVSLRQLITAWEQTGDPGRASRYVASVADELGAFRDENFDPEDSRQLRVLVESIIKFENGVQPYAAEVFDDVIH